MLLRVWVQLLIIVLCFPGVRLSKNDSASCSEQASVNYDNETMHGNAARLSFTSSRFSI